MPAEISPAATTRPRRGPAHHVSFTAAPREHLGLRTRCVLCQADWSPARPLVDVPCHVRAFLGETFQVWRCQGCGTIHNRQIVDLPHYYARYPFAQARLTWPFRMFYRNLRGRLRRYGLSAEHTLLDYGCGRGLFVKYLRRNGHPRSEGFDPYGQPDRFGDRRALEQKPFDYILLQDVLEHVEDPRALLAQLDGLLRPGGVIFIGTPNAERIDLARPLEFLNELHAPYHLHILTRRGVEELAQPLGWKPIGFFDRAYHDTRFPGLNTRAGKCYQELGDGTLDAALEPPRPWRLAVSPRFWWHALTGYWRSQRADMTVVLRKAT